jgi:hypothetical protein
VNSKRAQNYCTTSLTAAKLRVIGTRASKSTAQLAQWLKICVINTRASNPITQLSALLQKSVVARLAQGLQKLP